MIILTIIFLSICCLFLKMNARINYNLWFRLFKRLDFMLIIYILHLKFSNLFMQFQIKLLQFNNVKLDFWIAYIKLRRKILWAFHKRFPQGLGFEIGRFYFRIIVR